MLLHMRHAQHAAQNLLDVNRRVLVGQRGQDVGKRAVPAFLERIHRDDVAHRAVPAHQVVALEFVDVRRLDGDLRGRHLQRHQRLADFFKRGVVVCRARLGLKQHDGPHVLAAFGFFLLRQGFELAAQNQRAFNHLGLIGAVGHDHRQLDHVALFQRQRIDVADDVAVAARRGGQVKNEVRVQVLHHFHRQRALGIVAFVHHHNRLQAANHIDQRRRVVLRQQPVLRVARWRCQKRGQVAVFLKNLAVFLVLGTQRVKAHHHDRQLCQRHIVRKTCAHQQVAFFVHRHAVAKQHVEPPAIRVGRVAQRLHGLLQNGQRRHQPHHQLGPARLLARQG